MTRKRPNVVIYKPPIFFVMSNRGKQMASVDNFLFYHTDTNDDQGIRTFRCKNRYSNTNPCPAVIHVYPNNDYSFQTNHNEHERDTGKTELLMVKVSFWGGDSFSDQFLWTLHFRTG